MGYRRAWCSAARGRLCLQRALSGTAMHPARGPDDASGLSAMLAPIAIRWASPIVERESEACRVMRTPCRTLRHAGVSAMYDRCRFCPQPLVV
ncbi:hypothetical protein DM46_1838 [Burkholderia mallei]|nr:hypothetical protein DM46_1838 [Burkholderia mallei]